MNWKRNTLDNHSTLPLNHRREVEVEVIEGAAYVTQEGDPKDYIVKSGESLRIAGRGLVVIEGFPHAEVQICA